MKITRMSIRFRILARPRYTRFVPIAETAHDRHPRAAAHANRRPSRSGEARTGTGQHAGARQARRSAARLRRAAVRWPPADRGPARPGQDHACARDGGHPRAGFPARARSEEHTSELKSLMRIPYAVFCLKKKNIYTPIRIT